MDDSAQSTQTNKSRLRLLQRREEHLQDLFETARTSVSQISEDEGRYQQLLEGLILQVSLRYIYTTSVVANTIVILDLLGVSPTLRTRSEDYLEEER